MAQARYKLISIGGPIFDQETMASFCVDPEDPLYQAYLSWLAEGNEPEPADPEAKN